jgi:pre-rRNA-processing protein TSR1
VPLSALADCAAIQKSLIEAGDVHAGLPGGVSTVLFRAQKQRMTFIPPPVGAERNLMSVLELARMADMLLVVLPLNGGIESAVDAEGELMLTALKCQGLPCVVGVMQGLGALPGKKEKEGRSWGQRFFASEFADAAKVADARSETQLLRAITSASPRPLHWRSMRSYIVSEQVDISDDAGGASATLKVRGYVRGRPLNPDNLVHVSDVGACRLLRACKVSQPCPTRQSDECADPDPLVEGDSSRQEDLDFEAEPDPLAGEQTWPTEDELLNAASRSDLKDGEPSAQRRPGGWSTYQSAWLLDDTNDDGAASDGEKQDLDTILAGGAREEDEEEAGEQAQDEPWFDDGEGSDDDADMMDDAESSRLKREAEAEDREFPDEVETPNGMTARRRFARFRALKSFRSSPWDAKESLPRDYGRIYQVRKKKRRRMRWIMVDTLFRGRYLNVLYSGPSSSHLE